jgi:glutamyl-tRNA reductase
VLRDLPFHVIGISHHTATVEVRERFAFKPGELSSLLDREARLGRSPLFLSTCNRCELYWSGDYDYEPWFRAFARERDAGDETALNRFDGLDAVHHLFRVAAGLDSQILGETEILGQVRRAHEAARAAGATTRHIDAVFAAALTAGRRVRRDTELGRHPASVSSAAVDVAAAHWGDDTQGRKAVVLGAGEMAEGVLRALHARGVDRVALVTRNPGRAMALAAGWGAEAFGWESFSALVDAADLLVVATAAARPVVSVSQLRASREDADRELVILDLAVPRNVEPAARSLRGVRLFDLDDLQRLCCPAAGTASAALADAERVVEVEVERLDRAVRSRAAAPKLSELHRHGAQVVEQETDWALSLMASLNERERRIVRELAERVARRVLYPVSRAVRSGGQAGGRTGGRTVLANAPDLEVEEV